MRVSDLERTKNLIGRALRLANESSPKALAMLDDELCAVRRLDKTTPGSRSQEQMLQLQRRKRLLATGILEGGDGAKLDLSADDVDDLFAPL